MKRKRIDKQDSVVATPKEQSVGPDTFLLICALLVVIILVPYWQSLGHSFITQFDDNGYVVENSHIHSGLNMANVRWAFTTYYESNWHPLTWISHMIDCGIWGLDPEGHHLTNIILHILNTLLLFLLLCRMTGSVWKSSFVAALFAIHPVHVESVAWVSERKDVLSTLFWLLTMYAYAIYAKKPGVARYLPVLLCFALGLMAKPMLVSLPIVLLLLDYWPLDRVKFTSWSDNNLISLFAEKMPLFAMVVGSSIITFIAQKRGGAVGSLEVWSPGVRIANAVVAYVLYIWKMICPIHLAAFYPHPGKTLSEVAVIGAALLMAAITYLVIRFGKRYPYLVMGWFWYVITLVPVIGLVQVGMQGMADRYTYITLIGLFVIIAWGIPDLFLPVKEVRGRSDSNRKALESRVEVPNRRVLAIPAAVVIVGLTAMTWVQVGYWKNSVTLFEHAAEVTTDNYLAYGSLGTMYKDEAIKMMDAPPNEAQNAHLPEQKFKEAEEYSRRSIGINPDYVPALNTLGILMDKAMNFQESADLLNHALKVDPKKEELYNNLGNTYSDWGTRTGDRSKYELAIMSYNDALKLDPHYARAHCGLGALYGPLGKVDKAIHELELAVADDPSYADAHGNLAIGYFLKKRYRDAWTQVHLCIKNGGNPDMRMVGQLRMAMPEPAD